MPVWCVVCMLFPLNKPFLTFTAGKSNICLGTAHLMWAIQGSCKRTWIQAPRLGKTSDVVLLLRYRKAITFHLSKDKGLSDPRIIVVLFHQPTHTVCGHLDLSCDGKICQNTEAQQRQRRYVFRQESAGTCGIPTFALDLFFLLNASAMQLSMRFPNSSLRDTESINPACN